MRSKSQRLARLCLPAVLLLLLTAAGCSAKIEYEKKYAAYSRTSFSDIEAYEAEFRADIKPPRSGSVCGRRSGQV